MYIGRAKKVIQQLDKKDYEDKHILKHAEKHQRDTLKSEFEEKSNFRPEELPDGACFRLKSINIGIEDGTSAARPAEYIGSFSVSGEKLAAQTEFVQHQLENMHVVERSKKVLLVISLSGVKVYSSTGESMYMAHALKRISYAVCDPEYQQFAFLAREPKGHISMQFCHAFTTRSPEEAEELNTIIGNAFKMAYAQQKTQHQPTFNELIEKQLVEQKAKFAEYQLQANHALQQRLNEIATPTALQMMEIRCQSSIDDSSSTGINTPPASDELVVGRNKIWAKQAVQQVQHSSPAIHGPMRCQSPTFMSPSSGTNQQNVVGSRRSDPAFYVTKRNSNPVQSSPSKTSYSSSNSPNRNSSPHLLSAFHNFQVVTIRESLEKNVINTNRYKGSPVTALKDEIDRRYLCNGSVGTLDSLLGLEIGDEMDSLKRHMQDHHYNNEDQAQAPVPGISFQMRNRPLPAILAPDLVADHRASPNLCSWTSIDDNVVPCPTRSSLQPRVRDSPKRRLQRPQSEVILDSRFSAFSVPSVDQTGVYIYGFKSQTQNDLSRNSIPSEGNNLPGVASISQKVNNNFMQQQLQHRDLIQQKYSPKGTNFSNNFSKGGNCAHTATDNMQKLQNGKSSPPLHYQSGSPCHSAIEHVEESPAKSKGCGLESLMGLDRSHIEDETLRHASWYQAGIPRDVALEILQQENTGAFIVRDSSSHPGNYALSVRVPKFENSTGIAHYLIIKTARGVKLKGLDKEWLTLLSLVTHHTVMPEMLPCTLRLPRDIKNPAYKDCDKDDKDEDPDYHRLADFSSMMDALKQ